MSAVAGESGGRRLFVALRVPDAVRQRLAAVRHVFGAAASPFRWVRPDGMHLTLVFLGATPERLVPAICDAVRATAATATPLALQAEGVGAFPNARRPRVLWAGQAGDVGPLQALQRDLDERLRALGCRNEHRPYRAHVTLARAAGGGGAPAVPDGADRLTGGEAHGTQGFGAWTAREVELIHSQLTRSGATYTTIFAAPLGGSAHLSRSAGSAGSAGGGADEAGASDAGDEDDRYQGVER